MKSSTDGHRAAFGAVGDDPTKRSTGQEFFSLLEELDLDAIADEFDIGRHTSIQEFEQHLKVAVLEGLEPSDSLETLAQQTTSNDRVDYMAASTVSELTNTRDYRAVVQVVRALLHSPQLYRQRGVDRKRLEWLDRQVVAVDATHLALDANVVVQDEGGRSDGSLEVRPEDGGLKLHLAARVDGEHKQPLAATVTHPNTHESSQFDELQTTLTGFTDLESPIQVFDRGFTDYDRFCELKAAGEDFVTVLKSNARTTVVDRLQAVEVRDEAGRRQVTDDLVELGETGEVFRRVTVKDTDGDVTASLTTLSPADYAPIDVVSIYTLRWLIEILFRELKQYCNVEQFHSTTLNGALFELFCTWIAYLLVQWFRHRHPLRGGVRAAIRFLQVNWNRSLPEYG